MVSDLDIVTRLREILGSSDLDTATPATVRRQLEADFGVDFTDKKAFIRDQIDAFLESNGSVEEESLKAEEEEEEDINAADEIKAVIEDGNGSESEEEKEERPVKAKKRGGGFTKVCQLSPQLEKLVGTSQLARTEVVKKIWAYIKGKGLQDPKDRRKIVCDELLHSLFRVKTINMFQMNKALTKHIWPLGDGDGCANNVKEEDEDEDDDEASEGTDKKGEQNEEVEENKEEENEDEEVRSLRKRKRKKPAKSVEKPKRKGGGGFAKVCSLSPELQAFTGVTELARTEVVKMLWKYIKENNLQDPNDGRTIICDESLLSLFPVESINMFQMNKLLTKHIWPLDNNAESVSPNSPKNGKQKMESDGDTDSEEPNEKDKKLKTEDLPSLPLSDALVKFLGNGESSLSRADS
ncbi:upstream activation factor subunit spp27 isoform X1 [Capsella rubella]|uniref:upstream activation factor subunit spp27 isoform X1 n=1 Tax=Capsella rubella TaxID=81985 RepID=UPI000CD58E1F|nr:upstream activation factor subunit spp27 isoform X1 [Capsella rubella]